MSESQITRSALSWLRETDTLTMKTLKRAYWERLDPTPERYGIVTVENKSYGTDSHDHDHEVGVSQHGIVHHCTCGQFKYRDEVCKHMVSVAMAIDGGELDLQSLGCKEDVVARAEPREV